LLIEEVAFTWLTMRNKWRFVEIVDSLCLYIATNAQSCLEFPGRAIEVVPNFECPGKRQDCAPFWHMLLSISVHIWLLYDFNFYFHCSLVFSTEFIFHHSLLKWRLSSSHFFCFSAQMHFPLVGGRLLTKPCFDRGNFHVMMCQYYALVIYYKWVTHLIIGKHLVSWWCIYHVLPYVMLFKLVMPLLYSAHH